MPLCTRNWVLSNFKRFSPKNKFCVKFAQRIQLALQKLRLTAVFVGNCSFLNFNALLPKYAFFAKISRKNTTRS